MCIRDRLKHYRVDKMQNVHQLPDTTREGAEEYANFDVNAYMPVSYTHLDVYKRQVQPGRAAAAHTAHGLDAVADGMAKVQAGADAALALVLFDDLLLELQTAVDDLFNIFLGVRCV